MRNQSIVIKIVVSVCGIVAAFLLPSVFFLMEFQINLVKTSKFEHLKALNSSIDDREQGERASLRSSVGFGAEILNQVGGGFLYSMNTEALNDLMRIYMKYPVMLAIEVSDEFGETFTAAWKSPHIMIGETLPDNIRLDRKQSFHFDYKRKGRKIGSFHVYYTDTHLTEKIREIREDAVERAKIFEDDSRVRINKIILGQSLGVLVTLLVLIICLVFFMRAMILKPVLSMASIARSLATFDITVSSDTKRRDEIGMMMIALNSMILELRKIVIAVKSKGKQLAGDADQMMDNVNMVASATEEISMNIGSVVKNSENMLESNTTVAASIEKMSASVNQVGINAHEGSRISGKAVEMAGKAKNTMTLLGEAANEIGEVTEVIKRIAEKTTLLALNADIEAASAGEAGRGFAVVASEIREFARLSTLAADDIASRISDMQGSAIQAVSVIGEVSDIIHKLNVSSETISVALEDQVMSANDIASHAAQANFRAGDIASAMNELANGANEVASRVGIVARGAETTDEDADNHYMNSSAARVAKLASELLILVEKFKVNESVV